MRNRYSCFVRVTVLAMAAAGTTQAHHSLSGQFDIEKSFAISGVVSRVDWVNPHTYIHVDVKLASGAMLTYKLESLPVAMMRKAGLSRQELMGDGRPVQLKAYPARNGSATLGYLVLMKLPDGKEIQFGKVPGAENPAGGAQ